MTDDLQPADDPAINAGVQATQDSDGTGGVEQPVPLSKEDIEEQLCSLAGIARDPQAQGKTAFEALAAYQDILMQQGYGLDEDYSYQKGGFESYLDFQNEVADQALFQAGLHIDNANASAEANSKAKYDLVTIDNHPVNHFEMAYTWIQKSGLRLFANSTYAALGCTQASFFETFREMHIMATRSKLRILRSLVKTGENDERGYDLIEQVLNNHMHRLGIYGVDEQIGKKLGSSSDELNALHQYFSCAEFRRILEAAIPFKPHRPEGEIVDEETRQAFGAYRANMRFHEEARNSHAYCQQIINAAKILLKTGQIENRKATFEGTGFDKISFNAEFSRCAEILIRHHLDVTIKKPDVTGIEMDDAMQFFDNLRAMYGKQDMPPDADSDHLNEDYWQFAIFREYGFRSFTHYIDNLEVTSAAGIIRETLHQETGLATEIYDRLDRAEGMFEAARQPSDDPELMRDLHIDFDRYQSLMVETAPHAANHHWAVLSHIDPATEDDTADISALRSKIVASLRRACSRIEGHEEETFLEFNPRRIEERDYNVMLRQAEEVMADSRICIDNTPGQFKMMKTAYDCLDEQSADLLRTDVYRGMGMRRKQALAIERAYHTMELVDRWKRATNENTAIDERFKEMKGIVDLYKNMDDDLVAELERRLETTLQVAPPILRDLGLELYRVKMAEFQDNTGDAMLAFAAIDLAKTALETVNPSVFYNDHFFARVTGIAGDRRALFLAEHERYRRLSENWADRITPEFFAAAGGIDHLSEALKPHNLGAQAYKKILDLARALSEDGRSIMDHDVLSPARMTRGRLQKFIEEKALEAAAEQVRRALERKGRRIGLEELKEHSYSRLRAALTWVSRTSFSVLDDKPWKILGFADRNDFIMQLREQGRDLRNRLEMSLIVDGLQKGPLKFLNGLREIETTYQVLGIAPEDRAIDRDVIRRSIRSMGYAACMDALASKSSASAKFKMISGVLTYASRMDARIWTSADDTIKGNFMQLAQKRADTTMLNRAFFGLIENRVKTALENYKDAIRRTADRAKDKDKIAPLATPHTTVSLALAINQLRKNYNLDKEKWFQEAFEPLGFASFSTFSYHAAYLRMKQLTARVDATCDKLTGRGNEQPAHIKILRDLERIDALVEHKLIGPRERIQLFRLLDLPETWMRDRRRESAPYALPTFERNIWAPVNTHDERLDAIDEIRKIGQAAGTRVAGIVGIDWQRLDQGQAQSGRHSAAVLMVNQLVRGAPSQLNATMFNMLETVAKSGNDIADPQIWRGMGMNEGEIKAVSAMVPLLPLYEPLKNVMALGDQPDPHYFLKTMFDYLNTAAPLDVTTPQNLQLLGFPSLYDYKGSIDIYTMRLLDGLNAFASEALEQRDIEKFQIQMNTMLQVLDVSKVEQRHDLEKMGVPTRTKIIRALADIKQQQRIAANPAP